MSEQMNERKENDKENRIWMENGNEEKARNGKEKAKRNSTNGSEREKKSLSIHLIHP